MTSWDYRHIDATPPTIISEAPATKPCKDCGREVQTTARNFKRCPSCFRAHSSRKSVARQKQEAGESEASMKCKDCKQEFDPADSLMGCVSQCQDCWELECDRGWWKAISALADNICDECGATGHKAEECTQRPLV